MSFKEKVMDFLLDAYTWLFRAKPSKEIRIFIESLFFVFIATGISKGLLLIINLLGGRILGPTVYGEYSLIAATAALIGIPIGIGAVGGLVKSLADISDENRQRRIISTVGIYFMLTLLLFTVIYLAFYRNIAAIAKMGPNVFLMTIAFMFIMSIAMYMEYVLQGLHMQKQWSWYTSIAAVISFIIFVIMMLLGKINIFTLYFPNLLVYFIFFLISLFVLRKYTRAIFDREEFKKAFHYGTYVFIITLASTFLGNLDKLMLGYFLGAESVGIYTAYYFSSIALVGVLSGIFVRVFFPTAIKIKDTEGIFKKIKKVLPYIIICTAILSFISQYVMIWFYKFPLYMDTLLYFVITTVITTLFVIYSTLLSSGGTSTIKKTAIIIVIGFIINAILNYLLIPILKINGSALATLISYAFMTVYVIITLAKNKDKQRDSFNETNKSHTVGD